LGQSEVKKRLLHKNKREGKLIMSVAAIWDRFWWSMMWTIFIGLLWLKFVDPTFHHIEIGLSLSLVVGVLYFVTGIRSLFKEKKQKEELERKSYEEWLAESDSENAHD
jgi:hypothetical protein